MKKSCAFKILALFFISISACAQTKPAAETNMANPPQNFTYKTPDHTIHGAWTGKPEFPPILFVHGSPGSWGAWKDFLNNQNLQSRFQLIAVDRPGYGGSDLGKTERSVEIQARDIVEALKQNQSGQGAILIGHSYGGPVIARIAMDFPDLVRGLIFVAGSVDPELEATKWYQHVADTWLIRHLIPTNFKVCNEEIMALKPELVRMLPLWDKIRAKTVIVQGTKDTLVQPENTDFLLKKLDPKIIVKAVLTKDMNHFVPWEHPELIIEGIDLVNK